MKVYTVTDNPLLPCYVLRACNCTILFDCPLDLSPLLHFVPLPPVPSSKLRNLPKWQFKDVTTPTKLDLSLKCSGNHILVNSTPEVHPVDMRAVSVEEIDVVLISNYYTMLGLPFLTEEEGFRAQIYLTEPTRMMGRMLMTEMAEYFESGAVQNHSTKWKNWLNVLPVPLREQFNCKRWHKCFTRTELQRSLSNCTLVNYLETKNIPEHVSFTAISSGYGVGACNWLLDLNGVKFAYVTHSSVVSPHAKAMEQQMLKNCEVMLLSGMNQGLAAHPEHRLAEFCSAVETTIRNGGNVIVPSYLTDNMYDLVDTLAAHFDSRGITNIPVFVAAPMGPELLGHANIFCEWVTDDRRVRVFIGDSPFQYIQLMQLKKLKSYKVLHEKFNNELEFPCILFTSHPLLRFGYGCHFLEMWGQNRSNVIIFTEPGYNYIHALAPYQPLQIKVLHLPIDVALNMEQLNELLKHWGPKNLLSHPAYLSPPNLAPQLAHLKLKLPEDCVHHPCLSDRVVNIRSTKGYYTACLDAQVAASCRPVEFHPGMGLNLVSAILDESNLQLKLKPFENKRSFQERPAFMVYGKVDGHELARQLERQGISDVKVEQTEDGYYVQANDDTLIQIGEESTHIISQGNEELRVRLKDTLTGLLNKLGSSQTVKK